MWRAGAALSLVAVHGLLSAVAYLVGNTGSRHTGISRCSTWPQ